MKTCLIIAISLFAVSLCRAETLSVESCAAIEDSSERLACYDALAGRPSADTEGAGGTAPDTVEPAAPAAEVVVPDVPDVPDAAPIVPATAPGSNAEAEFGFEHKRKPDPDRVQVLKTRWTRIKRDSYGKWIITMENGQVWRQIDSTRFRFQDPEQRVVVSPGVFGSFFLGESERGSRIRVKRVR